MSSTVPRSKQINMNVEQSHTKDRKQMALCLVIDPCIVKS